jgi:CheY-like chemotaxis protein
MTQIIGRVVSPNGASAHGARKQASRLDRFFSDRLNFDQLPVWSAGITACGATSPIRMIGRVRCGLVPPPLLPWGIKPMTKGQSDGIVAVIDDDEDVRDVLCALLQSEGHATEAYESGTEFLRDGGVNRAACIIVDQNMPGITGLALLTELATRGSEVPALLITGDPSIRLSTQARRIGAMTVMEKPMPYTEFLNFVAVSAS